MFPPLVFLMIRGKRKNLMVDQVRKNIYGKMCLSTGKPREGKNRRKRSGAIYIDLRSSKRYSSLKNANCKNRVIRKMCVCLTEFTLCWEKPTKRNPADCDFQVFKKKKYGIKPLQFDTMHTSIYSTFNHAIWVSITALLKMGFQK